MCVSCKRTYLSDTERRAISLLPLSYLFAYTVKETGRCGRRYRSMCSVWRAIISLYAGRRNVIANVKQKWSSWQRHHLQLSAYQMRFYQRRMLALDFRITRYWDWNRTVPYLRDSFGTVRYFCPSNYFGYHADVIILFFFHSSFVPGPAQTTPESPDPGGTRSWKGSKW